MSLKTVNGTKAILADFASSTKIPHHSLSGPPITFLVTDEKGCRGIFSDTSQTLIVPLLPDVRSIHPLETVKPSRSVLWLVEFTDRTQKVYRTYKKSYSVLATIENGALHSALSDTVFLISDCLFSPGLKGYSLFSVTRQKSHNLAHNGYRLDETFLRHEKKEFVLCFEYRGGSNPMSHIYLVDATTGLTECFKVSTLGD